MLTTSTLTPAWEWGDPTPYAPQWSLNVQRQLSKDMSFEAGYVGNPAIFPLIYNCSTHDVVIIHINLIVRRGVPTTAADIRICAPLCCDSWISASSAGAPSAVYASGRRACARCSQPRSTA